MEYVLIFPLLIGFLSTLLALPFWIRKVNKTGLVWKDMNKSRAENVAGSGGIIVLLGFCLGVLSYIAIKTFILNTDLVTIEIFGLLTTTILAGFIGIIDDFLG